VNARYHALLEHGEVRMSVSSVHICKQAPGAPSDEGDFELGSRWVCECGSNFVYREGFNRGGYLEAAWWPAPPVPRQRGAVRSLLFGARQG
jgi:hypothetical protein